MRALHIASIRAAKACIYMENQYFTSPLIAAELAARLKEPNGPEVILISTEHSPSYFDQVTMDRTRLAFLKTLKNADKHGRFHAYSPVTTPRADYHCPRQTDHHRRYATAHRLGQHQQPLTWFRHRMRPLARGQRPGGG